MSLSDYAVANQIAEELEFAWWVPYTLKKSNRIISKVKTKYWSKNHKYGLRLTQCVTEAMKIYQ